MHDANTYQELAARTLLDQPDHMPTEQEYMVLWNALGLGGEAGEVLDLVKKGVCHRHGLDREKLKKELGDVLWYVSALCSKLGFTLEEVMQANIDKLRQRYPEGYTAAASQARADTE
jgi:NTP pyrophosphatase (non-canonical NTP hydrolase)